MKLNIKKTTLDNFLIISLMISTIAPVNYAKLLVLIFNFLILVRIFNNKTIFFDRNRILVFILIVPGIMLTAINAPQELVRFFIILIIIFKFPFTKLKMNKRLIFLFSLLILAYLISTQILISYGSSWVISFRASLYPSEYSELFNMGVIESLFSSFGNYRAGGLFHNPNLLAMIVLLYFVIFDLLYSNLKDKSKFIYLFIFTITIISLLLTYSRTAIGGFIIYNFFKNTNFQYLFKGKLNKNYIFYLIILVVVFRFMLDDFLQGFTAVGSEIGSGYLKFEILIEYFKSSNMFELLLGGTHDIFFDAEFGNWIGAVGILGTIGLIILFTKVYNQINDTLPFLFLVMLTSIGNTLFYGLLTANIAYIYLLIISSLKNNT